MVVPTVKAPRLRLRWKLRQRLSCICTTLFYADNLIKPHDFIWVVKMWCGMRGDPVVRCLDHPEELNNVYLPSGHSP
jgi:hypothetical protein